MIEKWDKRFLEMAQLVASWSKDPSTKVGAVIVNRDRVVIGMGYNGFPRGVYDHPERYEDRTQKYPCIVHAEINAVLNAAAPVKGCAIYCTFAPCPSCMGLLIQAGIKRVVYLKNESDERWAEARAVTHSMCDEAGIYWEDYGPL